MPYSKVPILIKLHKTIQNFKLNKLSYCWLSLAVPNLSSKNSQKCHAIFLQIRTDNKNNQYLCPGHQKCFFDQESCLNSTSNTKPDIHIETLCRTTSWNVNNFWKALAIADFLPPMFCKHHENHHYLKNE